MRTGLENPRQKCLVGQRRDVGREEGVALPRQKLGMRSCGQKALSGYV